MHDFKRTSELRAEGFATTEIAGRVRAGELDHLRRGSYASAPAEPLDETAAHRLLIAATAAELEPGAVISHASAALLHGWPVWRKDISHVHVTRDRSYGAKRRSVVSVHCASLPDRDVTLVDGMATTVPTRTVIDLGRTLSLERSVAAGDKAVADGLSPGELELALLAFQRWPGVRMARRAVEFLDPRSASAGESASRVRMMRDGVPPPELQYEVYDRNGEFVGRSDFAWPQWHTLGEFDGTTKYGVLLKPGQSPADAVIEEKIREDALRDLGHQVVRWMTPDIYRPGVIRDRLFRAFDRATGGSWRRTPHP